MGLEAWGWAAYSPRAMGDMWFWKKTALSWELLWNNHRKKIKAELLIAKEILCLGEKSQVWESEDGKNSPGLTSMALNIFLRASSPGFLFQQVWEYYSFQSTGSHMDKMGWPRHTSFP